jgi:predicted Zn-dependent protease
MSWKLPRYVPRSAPVVLLILTAAAAIAFAGVGHLVARYNANQQSRGRKLYDQGLTAAADGQYDNAIAAFRAALTCDPNNSQYQLSLARALRDSNDPRRLEEAESYLLALWQRTPQDGAVNLALARVAAHKGNVDEAIRYYHNAMYGVWGANYDANRAKTRIELIQFLMKHGARDKAESELLALASSLPPNPGAHLQVAELFAQNQDWESALSQCSEVLHAEPFNGAALACSGEAAYRMGSYGLAQRYLQAAAGDNSQDKESREMLATSELVLRTNPFRSYISDAERNRRIAGAFSQAENRLSECAQKGGADLKTLAPTSPLGALQARWSAVKPDVGRLRLAAETDLPDTIMEVVFQIEQQTAAICGPPQGVDEALLLISQTRKAGTQ